MAISAHDSTARTTCHRTKRQTAYDLSHTNTTDRHVNAWMAHDLHRVGGARPGARRPLFPASTRNRTQEAPVPKKTRAQRPDRSRIVTRAVVLFSVLPYWIALQRDHWKARKSTR
ncbi:hypothetical protein GCM10010329_84330 [Streptomyces spiroverticillatus]|uniref:Uncharacterized protein n=1 Tax=Streptomyces finlayi TaxID=67296 RepID=A0A919CDT0_9ACTN|nr:hypothetical protein GCM10010329_84330 [Streptomyces spiroverticillatus]GHD13658.1 hypothetical protein GCM10010334_72040 [Streptomyces finlayi]